MGRREFIIHVDEQRVWVECLGHTTGSYKSSTLYHRDSAEFTGMAKLVADRLDGMPIRKLAVLCLRSVIYG